MFKELGHLGGYVIGGDPWTYYPYLWAWLVQKRRITSVLDIGCGEGHAINFFKTLGCDVLGVEGVPQPNPDIVQHDFTGGPFVPPRDFDMVWSCEFLEHVEEKYLPNIFPAFSSPLVLITHAFPSQAGYHHVNCRTADYWIAIFKLLGYSLDEDLTQQTRNLIPEKHYHYARSGLAFRK